jgi:hypothetical protein
MEFFVWKIYNPQNIKLTKDNSKVSFLSFLYENFIGVLIIFVNQHKYNNNKKTSR